jgi:hypothetical protein
VIKINLTIYFACKMKRNGAADVRGNRAVNLQTQVPRIGLRASCETLGHHVLNIFRPCILRDVWWPGILPNRYVIPVRQGVFPSIFFSFFFSASYQKSRNLHDTNIFYELMTNEILIFKIKNIFLALIEYWHVSKQYRWNYCW